MVWTLLAGGVMVGLMNSWCAGIGGSSVGVFVCSVVSSCWVIRGAVVVTGCFCDVIAGVGGCISVSPVVLVTVAGVSSL